MTDAAYTVVERSRTGLGDVSTLVRRRGGGLVRVVVPLLHSAPDDIATAIDLALQRLPEPPGPNVH